MEMVESTEGWENMEEKWMLEVVEMVEVEIQGTDGSVDGVERGWGERDLEAEEKQADWAVGEQMGEVVMDEEAEEGMEEDVEAVEEGKEDDMEVVEDLVEEEEGVGTDLEEEGVDREVADC